VVELCAMSMNAALGDARWKFQEMPWSSLARFPPQFHAYSVGDEMVPLESAQNFANPSSASGRVRFHRMSVVMSPSRDRAIHIPN